MFGPHVAQTTLPVHDAMTVADALAAARHAFDGIDGRVLLRHATGLNEAELIAHPERRLTFAERQTFEHFIARRMAGEPLAYLIGEREFFGRVFKVTSSVLIPRPETELLVEVALTHLPVERPSRVVDLGTGSGCIAISIACEWPLARVIATDISAPALLVACDNARALGADNVEFVCGDWLVPLKAGNFDMIVANPPYVAAADPHLKHLRCEPVSALISGNDGLDAIRAITAVAPRYLKENGWLVLEHGYDQAECCRALLASGGFKDVFSRRDLARIERISGGCLRAGTVTSQTNQCFCRA